jgi:hypothetical protein
MLKRSRILLAGIALTALSLGLPAQAKALRIAGPMPAKTIAGQAEMIVIGKVTEIEKDTVEYSPSKDAGKIAYKIAVIKIEESVMGATGLTQLRVGFLDAPAAGPQVGGGVGIVGGGNVAVRPLPARIGGNVTLTSGQEACFFLNQLPGAEFYVLTNFSTPLNKKDEGYAKQLEDVKKVAKVIEEPVKALKAKDVKERFEAAQTILQRYNQPRGVKPGETPKREPIPAEENKLIVDLLLELPWAAKNDIPRTGSDPVPPSRSGLWYMIQPNELGYKQPVFPKVEAGKPRPDYNKIQDDATTKFLTENKDKIKITRFVSK